MSEKLNELWKRYDDAVCYLQQAMQDGFNVHGHLMAVAGLRDCIEDEISNTATKKAEPNNPGWCDGCNPDNCEGCGTYNNLHYLDTPIDWDLNGVPYTRKQAILDHCGPLALAYIEHAISHYTKD